MAVENVHEGREGKALRSTAVAATSRTLSTLMQAPDVRSHSQAARPPHVVTARDESAAAVTLTTGCLCARMSVAAPRRVFQTRAAPSSEPEMKSAPSAASQPHVRASEWPSSTAPGCRVTQFQTRAVWSFEMVTSRLPSCTCRHQRR